MIKKVTFILISFWLFQSCGSLKKAVPATGEVERQSIRVFKKTYESNIQNFDHLQIRSRIETDLNGKTNSATLRLYIQDDERIWANASLLGITGARANITPGKVQAYEVLDKTFIDSDFSFFNEKLKVNFINFDRLKSLLLGQLFLIDSWNSYDLDFSTDNHYILKYKQNDELSRNPENGKYIHSFYLDSNYRLVKVEIEDPNSNTQILVNYENWIEVNAYDLPGRVRVFIKSEKEDKIELEYINFDFTETNPPFNIPSGYSEREIN